MRKVIDKIVAKDGSEAQVVQHGRNLFSLTITSRRVNRNRWGNKLEIAADVEHFQEYGRLPGPNGERW